MIAGELWSKLETENRKASKWHPTHSRTLPERKDRFRHRSEKRNQRESAYTRINTKAGGDTVIIRTAPDPNSENPFLKQFSDYQLYEMYRKLSFGHWPELLGTAPQGFNELPKISPKKQFRKKMQKSRIDYTAPVGRLIGYLLGWEKIEVMHYLHSSTSQKIYKDLMDANPGSELEVLEELSEHLAKNLDL